MSSKEQIEDLLKKAWELRGLGNYAESKKLLITAQELCSPHDFDLLGRVNHIYMQHEYDHDNLIKALEFNSASIAYYTQAKNAPKIAHSIRHRADLQNELGQIEASESNYSKAIRIYKDELGVQNGDLANALRGYALILEKLKKFEEAVSIWEEIEVIYNELQFLPGVTEARDKIRKLKN